MWITSYGNTTGGSQATEYYMWITSYGNTTCESQAVLILHVDHKLHNTTCGSQATEYYMWITSYRILHVDHTGELNPSKQSDIFIMLKNYFIHVVINVLP